MLLLLFLLLMLVLAYVESRRGLFAGATFFISVLLAGVFAYQVWDPLASEMEGIFADDMLDGYEDAFALIIPFVIFLILSARGDR